MAKRRTLAKMCCLVGVAVASTKLNCLSRRHQSSKHKTQAVTAGQVLVRQRLKQGTTSLSR
jgi:ribosomal protein L27